MNADFARALRPAFSNRPSRSFIPPDRRTSRFPSRTRAGESPARQLSIEEIEQERGDVVPLVLQREVAPEIEKIHNALRFVVARMMRKMSLTFNSTQQGAPRG